MKKIAVIGAGGTGVALSAILASKGHEVYLTDNLNQTVVEAAQKAGIIAESAAVGYFTQAHVRQQILLRQLHAAVGTIR